MFFFEGDGGDRDLHSLPTRRSSDLVQESIGYMGCAAVHLKAMIDELSENEKDLVPVDNSLADVFKGWD